MVRSGALTLQCLRSLTASAWKPRVVVTLSALAFLAALLLPASGAGAQQQWAKLPGSGVDVAQCVVGTECIDTDLGKLFSYAADSSAVLLDDGVPLEAWASTLGVFVHRGTSPGDARLDDNGTDFGLSDDDLLERSADFQ